MRIAADDAAILGVQLFHMPARHIDLSYLERLYNGDRSRMAEWTRVYLEDYAGHFQQLADRVAHGDTQGLLAAAHDIRPLAHYLGAQRMAELLALIGQQARASGAAACAGPVEELVALSVTIEAELKEAFGPVPG